MATSELQAPSFLRAQSTARASKQAHIVATMRIDLTPDHLLSAAARRQINELSDAVYPPGSTPDWATAPIQWAPQTIRAMVWDDMRLVCHVGALVRDALALSLQALATNPAELPSQLHGRLISIKRKNWRR